MGERKKKEREKTAEQCNVFHGRHRRVCFIFFFSFSSLFSFFTPFSPRPPPFFSFFFISFEIHAGGNTNFDPSPEGSRADAMSTEASNVSGIFCTTVAPLLPRKRTEGWRDRRWQRRIGGVGDQAGVHTVLVLMNSFTRHSCHP